MDAQSSGARHEPENGAEQYPQGRYRQLQSTSHIASSPRIPAPTRALERTEAERQDYLREREAVERKSVLRGLIMLALLVLLASILRAGTARVFPAGWWRP